MVNKLEKINDRIHALRIPYKDIFTTVYFVNTEDGMLLFDTASYDQDIDDCVIPALRQLGVGEDDLKYVFISHNHTDHAGGLERLLSFYPKVCVVSRSDALAERFGSDTVLSPREGETLLKDLSVVFITGHTADSAALYDGKTKMLICGDCLQLYGIFGSGKWGANISFFAEYEEAISKLRILDIDAILTAHDYHPCGRMFFGKEAISAALDACLAPFARIQQLIDFDPSADDETICARYHSQGDLPTLAPRVVKRYRETKSIAP